MRRLLVALLVSAILVALVATLTNLHWREVTDTLAHLDGSLVALAALVYAASYVGRGLRLQVLMPGAAPLVHATSISARHIFLAVIMPFRMGEAALPVMLIRECGRPLAESATVLGLMRVLDLVAVAAFLLLGLALTAGSVAAGDGAQVGLRATLALAALLAGLLLMRPVCRALAPLQSSTHRALKMVGQLGASVAALSNGQLLRALVITLMTWACTYSACWILLRAMVVPAELGAATSAVTYAEGLVGTTGLHLAAVIPIAPIASVGTWELGWTSGYMLVGVPKEEAATSAIVSHVVIFGFIALIGGAGWLTRRPSLVPAPPSSESGWSG